MSLFRGHQDEPREKRTPSAAEGGADRRFRVLGEDAKPVWYTPDDFDEIFTTTDEHEAGRHVKLGWLLLDEVVGTGSGPARIEFEQRMVSTGEGPSVRTVPVEQGPDDVTTYVLGYLKPGRTWSPG